jgi:anti-anti-sigma regulatory factor
VVFEYQSECGMCETVSVKGSRIVGDRVAIMSPPRELDSAQAHEVEEQLFTTNRQQSGRKVPTSLPRSDFWENVKKLLSDIDLDIQDMLRVGATGIRLQNLQKRQANIRRIASDLARKRMVAMMQHAASQSMRATANTAKNQELPSLDWHRHDPEEKAFYHALQIQIDRFKMGVDWNGMQNGIAGEGGINQVLHAPGTMQLDSFSDKSLTGNPPPALAFEDDKPEEIEAMETDDEDRFSDTEWPDLDEHIHADLDDNKRIQETIASTKDEDEDMSDFMEGMAGDVRHAAAMELAPSSKASEIILEDTIVAQEVEAETDELIRVRILESLPEAIINAAGEEVTLEVGDVHFLDSLTAEMLVDGGFAKIAAL